MNFVVIPARKASKGIPNKNLSLILDKPLLYWTLLPALDVFGDVYVSSDDYDILSVAAAAGGTPLLRSKKLAGDFTTATEVALATAREFGCRSYDNIFMLQPTTPFRSKETLVKALEILDKFSDSVVSVSQTHPLETFGYINTIKGYPTISRHKDVIPGQQRQQMIPNYKVTGGLFAAKYSYLEDHRSFVGKSTFAYEVDKFEAIEIDTPDDFLLANYVAEARYAGK